MSDNNKLSYMPIVTGNKENLKKSKNAYCLCCRKNHLALNVTEFCDNGTTGLCPDCFVDAIVPDYPTKYLKKQLTEWSTAGFS